MHLCDLIETDRLARPDTTLGQLSVRARLIEERIHAAAATRRPPGASWSMIGAELGVSKQAAAKRFGP